MNIETHSWAAVRSSFEPPRSSYLKSIVLTSFALPNKAMTSPLSARSEKRCAIVMRPNYTRGYDKDGHTPVFLNDPLLRSALSIGGALAGLSARKTPGKNPAVVDGVPAVVIPCVR